MKLTDAVDLLRAEPARTGIFTDFDGTLSEIADRPDDAVAVPGAPDVLEVLAADYGVVAVISGRSYDALRRLLAPEGVVLAGSYGRQLDGAGRVGGTVDWSTVQAAALEATAGLEGVIVEPKERAVALHYRLAPGAEADVAAIAARLAADHALDRRPGRRVVELIEPGPGKGEALAGLVESSGVRTLMYAGDDVADIEAFEAARGAPVASVLVAVRAAESPRELVEQADLVVDGPGPYVEFLRALV